MIVKSRKNILEEMIKWLRNTGATLTDFNQGGVTRSILNAIAAIIAQLYYYLNKVSRDARISTSNGEALDIALAPRSMKRDQATKASVIVTLIGVGSTLTPKGTRYATEQGIEFLTTADGTMPSDGNTVDIPCEAVVAGQDGMVDANTIIVQVDIVEGITSVTNEAPTEGGFDFEPDEVFRNRGVTQLATLSQGTQASYQAWAREANSDVIRAKAQDGHAGFSRDTIVVHIVKNNSGLFTESELEGIAQYIQSKAPLDQIIVCLNITWSFIVMNAQVRVAKGFSLNDVRANITNNVQLYLDYRIWEWGDDLEWSDLFSLVGTTLGVDEVSLTEFLPSSNVVVGEYSLPKFSSLTVTDW